jgi:predicted  nucleic acid-binding Zn-ribbon protein
LLAQLENEQKRTANVLAERQADYSHLREEREKDVPKHRATQKQYEKDRERFDSRIREMEKQHKTADSERQRAVGSGKKLNASKPFRPRLTLDLLDKKNDMKRRKN